MKTDDFDYELPQELIAQVPLEKRSNSKLLCLDKNTGKIEHNNFSDIINYLHAGDVLVMNNTRVIPARLYGIKEDTKAHIELLLLHNTNDTWEALVKPARRVKVGTVISFGDGILKAKCTNCFDEGRMEFEMIYDGIFLEVLESLGEMPLPPYIHEKLMDKDRYQTVYAKVNGSAAAPTAGLHFTKEILDELTNNGIIIEYVTLHVGLGTFRPVSVSDVTKHHMHSEYYEVSAKTAEVLNKAKSEGRRIICVGTTSLRTLESNYSNGFKEENRETDIFIYPGYNFKAVDCLLTNFHLPKSTLIMLVSALATKEYIMKAYKEAVSKEYRFFSFGDAMFIHN